jgi:hypothetical protein
MDEQTLRTMEPGTRVYCTLRAWSPEHLCEWCEAYVLLGVTTTHGRMQAVVVGLPKPSAATGLADPYEQDGRDHAHEPVCVEVWNVHETQQAAADHSWELLVNQHKAMVRALSERCPPTCDPQGLHGFPVSAYCRATGDQRCHICEDADCGDNRTPSIERLREQLRIREHGAAQETESFRRMLEHARACMDAAACPSTPEAAAVAATAVDLFHQTVDQDLCVVGGEGQNDGPPALAEAMIEHIESLEQNSQRFATPTPWAPSIVDGGATFKGAQDAVPEGAGVLVPLSELQSEVEVIPVGARHSYLCQCAACTDGGPHRSDCAVHNAPAAPNGPCDCRDEAARVAPASGPTLAERTSEPLEPPLWKSGGGRSKATHKEPTAEERRAALLARLNGGGHA